MSRWSWWQWRIVPSRVEELEDEIAKMKRWADAQWSSSEQLRTALEAANEEVKTLNAKIISIARSQDKHTPTDFANWIECKGCGTDMWVNLKQPDPKQSVCGVCSRIAKGM